MKKVFLSFIIMMFWFSISWAGSVTLEWNKSLESTLAGYNLYRAERIGDHTTAWEMVATIAKEATTYVDEVDEKNYAWILTAFDNMDNESFPSNMVELKFSFPPVTNLRKTVE